jgi:hypothetical protein
MSDPRHEFTAEEARRFGEEIGIDWASVPFDVAQLQIGMNVELEHGLHDPLTNVTDDNPHVTAKIALAHLNEFPDYYSRLERMEEEAKGATRTDRRESYVSPPTEEPCRGK